MEQWLFCYLFVFYRNFYYLTTSIAETSSLSTFCNVVRPYYIILFRLLVCYLAPKSQVKVTRE